MPDTIRPQNSRLTDVEMLQRIDMCDRWMKRFRDADIAASRRFRDVNNAIAGGQGIDWQFDEEGWDPEGGDVPDYQPVGQPNWLTINIVTKIAAIAMGDPSLHVRANEDEQKGGVPNAAQIVSKAWKQSFKLGNWKRETQSGLQKRYVSGLGVVAYRWDKEYGPCFEHVPSWQLLVDPHATNWQRLRYGGRKIRMSLREAMERYDPDGTKAYFTHDPIDVDKHGQNLDASVVSIKLFYTRTEEIHAYHDTILRRTKNLYGKVPLVFCEGDIDPTDNPFPIGDNILAGGLQQTVTDLTDAAVNSARHGGPINLVDEELITNQQVREALLRGEQQGYIPVKGLNPQALPIHRIAGEQLAPAWSVARNEMQMALDGITGVPPAARGEQVPNVTATQSVMVEKRAGARPTQARSEYEAWMTRIAEAYIDMMQRFGGPTEDERGTDEQIELWRAFMAVQEVQVVEGSTTYSDPSMDQQQSMQLVTTVVQLYELCLTLAQAGLMAFLPNLKQYVDDMLRSFSRQNIESYWTPFQPPQQDNKPDENLVKALTSIYNDSPPDVRRQIEGALGVQPSQMGDQPEDDGAGDRAADMQARHGDHVHDALQGALQRAHEERMERMKQDHEARIKLADMGHQQRMLALKPAPKTNGKSK